MSRLHCTDIDLGKGYVVIRISFKIHDSPDLASEFTIITVSNALHFDAFVVLEKIYLI